MKTAAITSKTYILRSILDPELLAAAVAIDAELFEMENREFGDEVDDNDSAARVDGSLAAWDMNDSVVAAGITHVILALILVNSKVLPDRELFFFQSTSTSTFHLILFSYRSTTALSTENPQTPA